MKKWFVFVLGLIIILFIIFKVTYKKTNPSATTSVISGNVVKQTTPIDISLLRSRNYDSEAPIIEKILEDGPNYKRYIASYKSDGYKIYGLLTVPKGNLPESGYKAIVFNHGYIPPKQYVTTEKYLAYVDYLAKNGFVVFKIDLRGHGNSEGTAAGSYFSPNYTIDAINAVKSLQKLNYVDKNGIGLWGHSMAGNLVLRAALVSNDIKAINIWAGAVYSYEDFAKYRINDSSYVKRVPDPNDPHYDSKDLNTQNSKEVTQLREDPTKVDFNDDFWSAISLTKNIKYLNVPIQLNHADNDTVVNIGYSKDLVEILKQSNKQYEFYEYAGGGHNIDSPYFEKAMERSVEFFKKNL